MAEDFGLAAIADMSKKQNELTRKRQEEELAQQNRAQIAQQEKARITERQAKISQDLVGGLGPLVQTLDNADKARADVAALKESNNPLDFLDLVGKQTMNPELYTAKGRSKTVAEATQAMNARTQVASLQQAAMSDLSAVVDANLKTAGSGLEMAKMGEVQNAELIQAEMARVQNMAGTLQNNNALQQQKLAMMSEEETRAAAASANGQAVDVGGIMLSPGALEERLISLDNRKDMREARQLALETKNQALADKLAKRELESMNLEELRPMVLNGDARFNLADIKQAYDTKTAAQGDALARVAQEFQFQDFGARVTVPAMQDVERMAPAIPKNTPLAAALESHKNVIGTIMGTSKRLTDAGLPIGVEVSAMAKVALDASRAELDKAIDKEATLKAAGNKDLKTIYTELYRGNPAPRDVVETYLGERLDKGEPLTAVLPDEVGRGVQTRFNELFGKAQREGAMQPSFDKKQAKQEAIQQAITDGVGAKITERTQELFTLQLDDPTNPLYGAMSKNGFLGMVARADAEGDAQFKAKYGLNDEEFARFKSGESIEGKVGPQHMVDLGMAQNQQLFMQMDATDTGLSKRYVDWWQKSGPGFISRVGQGRQQAAQASGLQSMTMETFAGSMEKNQQAAYMQSLSDATDSYDTAKADKYSAMVTFDLNPSHRQAVLLQFDKTLSDSEKKTFMTKFIQPILKEAKEKRLEYTESNIAVEKAIDAGMTDDPEIAKILKKVSKGRQDELQKMESIMVRPFWRTMLGAMTPFSEPLERGWLGRVTANETYGWYKESLGESNGRP